MALTKKISQILFLSHLKRFDDATLFLMRLLIGVFLIWGVADHLFNSGKMTEFEGFLRQFEFYQPSFISRVSIWLQFFVGLSFVLGLFTRWAGVLCTLNFMIALIMVNGAHGIRAVFPAIILVLIGLYLATKGGGRYSLDKVIFNQ
ncbi:DoxX family protein [Aliikangiella sp. G2MR2-5]|uniref:DoxX family protein n=1 Tax=Aliikangiella sp. G2MR2-5 TaxID=2788943 RepID=UPI0018AA4048|nr:DoxX family protein [Aliikangiella sp. G2MR2-5]